MSVPNEDSRHHLAVEYLKMAHKNYRDQYAQRVYFARLAREHGATWREIADAYEVTEGAIRHMLKKDSDEQAVSGR